MASLQAYKSSKVFILIVMVLVSTALLQAGNADRTSASISAVTQQLTNVEECSEWTEWMDDENGGTLDPSSSGEFELLRFLRGCYVFCNEPTDIECALADDTNIPYNETGQVSLKCNLKEGFLCLHSQQSGNCSNYAIRLLCPAECSSLITPAPTPDSVKTIIIVCAIIAGLVVVIIVTLFVVCVIKGSCATISGKWKRRSKVNVKEENKFGQ